MDAGSDQMLRSRDVRFVMTLSQEAVGEAELGGIAAQKAGNDGVKQFGRERAAGYTQLGQRLPKLVNAQTTLPQELAPAQLALRTRLQNLTGSRFDRAYLKAMVKGEAGRIKRFKSESKKGQDPAVRKFAAETLPILQGYLEKARLLHRATAGKQVVN